MLELEVPAGAEAVRRRAQVELRTRQRCKIGSRNWSPRNRRHPRAMMAEAAAEDLVAEEVTLVGTLEAAQASRREAPRAEAAQSVRDFMGPHSTRSQSVMGPHPTLQRENSTPRSASMVAPQKAPSVPLTGDS